MGTFREEIEVLGPVGSIRTEALVDSDAEYSMLPANICRRLGINPARRMRFRSATGDIFERDLGEARIRVKGEESNTWVIFSDEAAGAILGAYSLEGLGFAVDPSGRRLVPAGVLPMM